MKKLQSNARPLRGGLMVKLLVVLAVLFGLAAVAWVVLLPSLVVSTLHSKTGFTVKIDKLSLNPFTATAQISGLVLQNPEGWPQPDFLEVRQFKADVRLWSFVTGRFVANEVIADVAQVTVVRNKDGALNSSAFTNGLTGTGGKSGQASPQAQNTGKSRGFMIHHLVLRFDKLVYADYTRATPMVKKYDVNLNQDMTEVDSVAKLISPITGSALTVMAGALGGVNLNDPAALNNAMETLQSAGKKAGESLKNMFRSLDNKKP